MIIPERHDICKALQGEKRALSVGEMTALFRLDQEQRQALCNRLEAMIRDGQLDHGEKGSYLIGKQTRRVTGIFAFSGGNASVRIDATEGSDLKIPGRLVRGLVDGDKLAVYVLDSDSADDPRVVSIELLARDRELAGVVSAAGYIEPLHAVGPHRIQPMAGKPPPGESLPVVPEKGSVVIVRLRKPDFRTEGVPGEIIETLGDHEGAPREVDIVLRAHNIPSHWHPDVLAEAERCKPVSRHDLEQRRDLRDMNFVTIDGEDAKDFDDAIFFEKADDGWYLWVAIADVSNYVHPASVLDEAASERGNSIYFPGRVVPMLPSALSNDLCSLRPKEERLAVVCKIKLSRDGKILQYEFMRAVIVSQARLTYSQVGRFLENGENGKDLDAFPGKVHTMLLEGLWVTKALLKQRKTRNALDLDIPETRMLLDSKGRVRQIVLFERNDAHRLVEECMICANICAARFLRDHNQNLLHRTHAGFKKDALEKLQFFLRALGMHLGGESNRDLAVLMEKIAKRDDPHVFQSMILRSLTRALYQPEEPGHYGLALDDYTHFTSPIRRYPDLLVHRAINAVIEPRLASSRSYDTSELGKVGEHCSMTEHRAEEATRSVSKYLKCLFIRDRVGETFIGIVVGVTDFGLFLELQEVYVEGLLHIGSLGSDYFHFDNQTHRLVGESSGQVYRLGDRIEVILSRVLPEERKVDFVLPGNHNKKHSKKKHSNKNRSRRKKRS